MTTEKTKGRGKMRNGRMLLSLALGTAMAAVMATAGTAQQAEAAFTSKMVFVSDRTSGPGVNNPTADSEIFRMNPDGTGVRQLTFNEVGDDNPTLSPDGTKVAYDSQGTQASNPEGDDEVYIMNASDGKGKKNLSNSGVGVYDYSPQFSPNGTKVAYESRGVQPSNSEGDYEVYRMNASDGTAKKNLSNTGADIDEYSPVYSPDGTKIAYLSRGIQPSNPEGDHEVYRMSASDGTDQTNLSDNGVDVSDQSPVYSPDGTKIAYESHGKQDSNPEGDFEVYRVNALDGTGKKNLSNNGSGVDEFVPDFAPDGTKIVYESYGVQSTNPQGDNDVYRMNTSDGQAKKNLSNNGAGVGDGTPVYSPGGSKVAYLSIGKQTSNPQGDPEVYVMDVLDGKGKKNLTNNGLDASDYKPEWGR